MIESLTQEQMDLMPKYVEKWKSIGLNTNRVSLDTAKRVAAGYYEKILNKPCPEVHLEASPIAAWKKVCELSNIPLDTPFVYPGIDGQFSAGYFSFYNYINEVLGIKYDNQDKYDWYQSTSEIGLFYPLDDFCVVSDRPSAIHMKDDRLHNTKGAAVEYTDGFKVYALNGVRVPEWLVMTPQAQLNGDMLTGNKDLENVEVRREFIRKVGIERCLTQLGWKVIDTATMNDLPYELGTVEVLNNSPRTYLKMQNPSVEGVWHLEAVHPDCKTVQHAINWRAYGDITKTWTPQSLS